MVRRTAGGKDQSRREEATELPRSRLSLTEEQCCQSLARPSWLDKNPPRGSSVTGRKETKGNPLFPPPACLSQG